MQSGATKNRSRRQSVSSKKTSKTEAAPAKPASVKRMIKDKGLKERAVRFRSTDEEYIFETEPSERNSIPAGSDIFQKILKGMKGNLGKESADDDEVFDGVFTATEKKTDIKKSAVQKKSILKRRNSYRR